MFGRLLRDKSLLSLTCQGESNRIRLFGKLLWVQSLFHHSTTKWPLKVLPEKRLKWEGKRKRWHSSRSLKATQKNQLATGEKNRIWRLYHMFLLLKPCMAQVIFETNLFFLIYFLCETYLFVLPSAFSCFKHMQILNH